MSLLDQKRHGMKLVTTKATYHIHHHLKMNNISLIGMAGVENPQLVLFQKFNLSFIDTDHLIENKFKMSLENIKKKFGYEHVRSAEEEVILLLIHQLK